MVAASELEGCVLGLLWKRGPCTPYSIRRVLLDSPSSTWSGSAGAIYPLLERFEKRGFVRSKKSMRGDREGWHYSLTAAGRKHFLTWLGPPLTDEVVSIAADPLRTRIHFLNVLTPRERTRFLDAARAVLERHLEALKPDPSLDEFDLVALDGALLVTRARLAWLEDVRRAGTKRKRTRR
jgi:DNA-binding PadR family transcriptional regulator